MASHSLIDMLDDAMIAQISSVLIAPLNARIRAICPRMRDVIARDPAQKIVKTTATTLFCDGAARGSRCLCALALGRADFVPNGDFFEDVMWSGVNQGNLEMCEIAHEFCVLSGKSHAWANSMMLNVGASNGWVDTCALAIRFACEHIRLGSNVGESPPMTLGAIIGNLVGDYRCPGLTKDQCRELIQIARSCTASAEQIIDLNDLLLKAAYCGRDDLCELAIELASTYHCAPLQFDRMLEEANEGDEGPPTQNYDAIRALHARMVAQ